MAASRRLAERGSRVKLRPSLPRAWYAVGRRILVTGRGAAPTTLWLTAPRSAREGLIRASALKGQFRACQSLPGSPDGDGWGNTHPMVIGATVQAGAATGQVRVTPEGPYPDQAATTRLRGARPLANLCHAAAPPPGSPSRLRRTLSFFGRGPRLRRELKHRRLLTLNQIC
jgi:hypothetical protein